MCLGCALRHASLMTEPHAMGILPWQCNLNLKRLGCPTTDGFVADFGVAPFAKYLLTTGIRALMPVITPRPTGHNARRWSGIIGVGVVILHRAYMCALRIHCAWRFVFTRLKSTRCSFPSRFAGPVWLTHPLRRHLLRRVGRSGRRWLRSRTDSGALACRIKPHEQDALHTLHTPVLPPQCHKRYKVMVDDSNLTGLFSAHNLSNEEREDG
eukprot:COSAG03_NODE_2831_length_2424_cov_7.489462_2_plen_211_part_00